MKKVSLFTDLTLPITKSRKFTYAKELLVDKKFAKGTDLRSLI